MRALAAHRVGPAPLVLALALTVMPPPLAAQGAPFAPIGSRVDRLASWVAADGLLPGLDPLVRPFRLDRLRRAVTAVDSAAIPGAQRRVFRELAAALDAAERPAQLVVEGAAQAHSHARRESFRPGGRGGVTPAVGVYASLRDGPFVAVVNPAIDIRLHSDPEWKGYMERVRVGRMQTAYLALTGERGELSYGRIARNWGPDLFDGLQLSPSVYATEALAGALRMWRLELTAIASRLDDRPTPDTNVTFNRFFFAHRLTLNAGRGVWVAFTETGVYGGPGQSFDPAMHAPLDLGIISELNDHRDLNGLWGVDVVVPLGRGFRSAASLYLDDIQADRASSTDLQSKRPPSFGASVVVSAALRNAPVHVSLGYTAVSYLSYRNSKQPAFDYTNAGVGIGRNFSDYDQLLARVEVRPRPRWYCALDLTRIRQGSGDFRDPFPSDSILATPGYTILVAPVHSSLGARLTWDVEPAEGLEFRGQLGAVQDATGKTVGIAALAARVRFDVLQRKLGGAFQAID
jgi:hypothetical protein